MLSFIILSYIILSYIILHICACVNVRIYVYIYTIIHTYIYTYTHTHTYIYIYIYIYIYLCVQYMMHADFQDPQRLSDPQAVRLEASERSRNQGWELVMGIFPWVFSVGSLELPSGKRPHNCGKSPLWRGKSTVNGPFSIGMSNWNISSL